MWYRLRKAKLGFAQRGTETRCSMRDARGGDKHRYASLIHAQHLVDSRWLTTLFNCQTTNAAKVRHGRNVAETVAQFQQLFLASAPGQK
jgi:hypothetical protein